MSIQLCQARRRTQALLQEITHVMLSTVEKHFLELFRIQNGLEFVCIQNDSCLSLIKNCRVNFSLTNDEFPSWRYHWIHAYSSKVNKILSVKRWTRVPSAKRETTAAAPTARTRQSIESHTSKQSCCHSLTSTQSHSQHSSEVALFNVDTSHPSN